LWQTQIIILWSTTHTFFFLSFFLFGFIACVGLNNSVAPSKSLATISNGLHPMIIQFPAYKGNRVFREVCTTFINQIHVLFTTLMGVGSHTMMSISHLP
jgi:hypothetical protein